MGRFYSSWEGIPFPDCFHFDLTSRGFETRGRFNNVVRQASRLDLPVHQDRHGTCLLQFYLYERRLASTFLHIKIGTRRASYNLC